VPSPRRTRAHWLVQNPPKSLRTRKNFNQPHVIMGDLGTLASSEASSEASSCKLQTQHTSSPQHVGEGDVLPQ
jgi:hypothetical protein